MSGSANGHRAAALSPTLLSLVDEGERILEGFPIGGTAVPSGAPSKSPLEAVFLSMRMELGASSLEFSAPLERFLTDEQVEQLPPVTFLVDGVIPVGAAAEVHGPPGSAKSFFALALSCSVAAGIGFCGRSVRRGPVVYVVAEGLTGVGSRLKAWKQHHHFSGSVNIHFRKGPVQLLDPVDVVRFIAAVNALPKPPALIVLDTLARCMVGGDENSAKDMGLAIAAIDRIRRETGAAVLLVHHTRKDGESERGSTALRGAMDAMLAMKNDGGRVSIACEKQKDASEFGALVMQLKQVDQSCVLTTLTNAWEQAPETLTLKHDQALTSLSRDFLSDGATCKEWLKASKIPESTFYRLRTDLVTWGFVAEPKAGRARRYMLTEAGRAAVTPNSHGTLSQLPRRGHTQLSNSQPPLGAESSGSDDLLSALEVA